MRLLAVWIDKREHDEFRRKRILNGLLVRHPDNQHPVLMVGENDYFQPKHIDEHAFVSVYVFGEVNTEVMDILIEAQQEGYRIQAVDARMEPWKGIDIPKLRVVGTD